MATNLTRKTARKEVKMFRFLSMFKGAINLLHLLQFKWLLFIFFKAFLG